MSKNAPAAASTNTATLSPPGVLDAAIARTRCNSVKTIVIGAFAMPVSNATEPPDKENDMLKSE